MDTTTAPDGTSLHVEQRGTGPDVLLIAGLGDPLEAWQAQLDGLSDRYRLIAFDNRGVGRTPLPAEPLTVPGMADDAAGVMRALGVSRAHVAGFSGGSAIAQELTLRHPGLVRSLVLMGTFGRADPYFRSMLGAWRRMAETAPAERAMLEAFFLWVYTRRAHADGTVAAIIEEALAFPHPQSTEAFLAQIEAFDAHDALDRLGRIAVPTLVLAGTEDIATPPSLGRLVAERIPGALFEVMEGEAHQPFQEVPDAFNDRVARFWNEADDRG
jgi:pimeloyl-ACP methyl ester carboxylesterase